MIRGRESLLSNCERQFISEAIRERKRLDGRSIYDYRHVIITPSHVTPGNVLVQLGETRVQACILCELAVPRPQRPTDGMLYFNVMPSPMASPHYEINARSNLTIKIERLLDRCFKESRSIDTESLCIIAGQKVWSIRVDLHVMNDCGNIVDCCVLASLTALKHFRRPDVTVIGEEATIHPVTEREPVPLNIHHFPICVTFGFCDNGDYMLVDPSHYEEKVLSGQLSLVMNIHREICTLQLEGGVALPADQIIRCTKIALTKVNELNDLIKTSLSGDVTMETNDQSMSILTSRVKESSRVIERKESKDELIIIDEYDDNDNDCSVIFIEEKVSELPCMIASAVKEDTPPRVTTPSHVTPPSPVVIRIDCDDEDSEEEETVQLVTGEDYIEIRQSKPNDDITSQQTEGMTNKERKRKKKSTTKTTTQHK